MIVLAFLARAHLSRAGRWLRSFFWELLLLLVWYVVVVVLLLLVLHVEVVFFAG